MLKSVVSMYTQTSGLLLICPKTQWNRPWSRSISQAQGTGRGAPEKWRLEMAGVLRFSQGVFGTVPSSATSESPSKGPQILTTLLFRGELGVVKRDETCGLCALELGEIDLAPAIPLLELHATDAATHTQSSIYGNTSYKIISQPNRHATIQIYQRTSYWPNCKRQAREIDNAPCLRGSDSDSLSFRCQAGPFPCLCLSLSQLGSGGLQIRCPDAGG